MPAPITQTSARVSLSSVGKFGMTAVSRHTEKFD
jgi:hypothetical protein